MIQPKNTAGRRRWGHPLPLTLLAALVLATPVSAAAPPPRPQQAQEIEGPPLFEVERFHTDPVHMTAHYVGLRLLPHTGAFSSAAVLIAGKHRTVNAWKNDGPLVNQDTSTFLGAATLFANGFRSMPGIGPALFEAGTLATGEWLHCWPLEDTDRFRGLPPAWLNVIRDGRMASVGTAESAIYAAVLVRAYYTSDKAFRSVARTDLIHVNLLGHPDKYRGEVVRISGSLMRIIRLDPPYEATRKGVGDMYEAWIVPDYYGAQMYCVLLVEWPTGLPRNLIGKGKLTKPPQVTVDGYFFKKYTYAAQHGDLSAPLLITHTLRYDGPLEDIPQGPTAWVATIVIGILVMTFGVLAGVIGLTYWYRRSDNQLRRRLLAARSPEFVLPPPDAMPVVPLAAPVRPELAHLPQRRFDIPPGLGDRPPPETGSDRGSAEAEPDEDAGSASRP